MRRLLFILLLSGLASGCATTSEVGYAWFGTGVDNDWGTGGEIRSHFSSYSIANVDEAARGYCAKRGLNPPSVTATGTIGEYRTFNFECNKPTVPPVVEQRQEVERLRAEAEASRQRQRQLEEQLNQARQSPAPSQPVVTTNTDRLSLDASKVKCTDLGFKPGTEAHGKCVLQLSK